MAIIDSNRRIQPSPRSSYIQLCNINRAPTKKLALAVEVEAERVEAGMRINGSVQPLPIPRWR